MAKSKFTGELAEPLKPMFRGGLLGTGEFREADVQERIEAQSRKLQLLAKHYAVEHPDLNTQTLFVALALAREFVPGFRVADPTTREAGRPEVWTDFREGFLIVEMDKVMRQRGGCGVAEAAATLSKRTPWKQLCKAAGAKDSASSLRQRYYLAKKSGKWIAVLEDAASYEQLTNALQDGIYDSLLQTLHHDFPKAGFG